VHFSATNVKVVYFSPHIPPDDLLKIIPCFSADHFTEEERQGCKVRLKSLKKLAGETCGQDTL